MSAITRALLLNVGIFEATNSIRRYKGTHSLNYVNAQSVVSKVELSVLPDKPVDWFPVVAPSVVIVRVSGGPVHATITLGVVAGIRLEPTSYLVVVNQFMILDDNVSLISFVNPGSSNVAVAITQG